MAQDFPMSLQQLLPLLDVIGNANKHMAKVRRECWPVNRAGVGACTGLLLRGVVLGF
jgi:hypothetical protein